jgi:hypothetical protein
MNTELSGFQISEGCLVTPEGAFRLDSIQGVVVESAGFGLLINLMVVGVGGAVLLQVLLANPIIGCILLVPWIMFLLLKRNLVFLHTSGGKTKVADFTSLSSNDQRASQLANMITSALSAPK